MYRAPRSWEGGVFGKNQLRAPTCAPLARLQFFFWCGHLLINTAADPLNKRTQHKTKHIRVIRRSHIAVPTLIQAKCNHTGGARESRSARIQKGAAHPWSGPHYSDKRLVRGYVCDTLPLLHTLGSRARRRDQYFSSRQHVPAARAGAWLHQWQLQ